MAVSRATVAESSLRKPAPWRSNPPVSDELWERVEEVRRAKAHGGGPQRTDRPDPLAGLLYCVCGRHVKANGTNGSGRVRMHPDPCPEWGARSTYPHDTWLAPLSAQVMSMRLDAATVAAVVRVLGQAAPPTDALARQRLLRQRQKAADAFASGRLGLGEFTALVADLEAQGNAISSAGSSDGDAIPGDVALRYLRDLRTTWQRADDASRAELLHAIYARVEVRGEQFVGVTLTPEAERHGLALALPEKVAVARPAGFEPAT